MDPQGTITREYLPTAKIIPLMEMNSVFVPHGEELFIREALQRRIFRIDAAGELSTFLTFDFGRWNIPTPTSRATTRCRPHRSSCRPISPS